jgi:starch synthase (maltosyl-transferring)
VTAISPSVACGQYPARAVTGETVEFGATVFREGHDAVAADVVVTAPDGTRQPFLRMQPGTPGLDRWHASYRLPADEAQQGMWTFVVEGWGDPLGTWWHDAPLKVDAGVDVELMLEEGARLYERALAGMPAAHRSPLAHLPALLRDTARDPQARMAEALAPDVVRLLTAHPVREMVTASEPHRIWVDRERALFGAWYEFFPRSEGAAPDADGIMRSGTFATAAERLPAVAGMGFDVVYLPPIHPIGKVNRKGPNSAAFPGGNPHEVGEHDPASRGRSAPTRAATTRSTRPRHDRGLRRLRRRGPASSAWRWPWTSPSRPRRTTPGSRPTRSGSPPRPTAPSPTPRTRRRSTRTSTRSTSTTTRRHLRRGAARRAALDRARRAHLPRGQPAHQAVRLLGVAHRGGQVDRARRPVPGRGVHPAGDHARAGADRLHPVVHVLHLAHRQVELTEYVHELIAASDYMRPNFFPNTPDILHASLQYGGPPVFKIRAVLASLLSPTYGIYAGYELYEHVAVKPGSEEYHNSEKYTYRPRDWSQPSAPWRRTSRC